MEEELFFFGLVVGWLEAEVLLFELEILFALTLDAEPLFALLFELTVDVSFFVLLFELTAEVKVLFVLLFGLTVEVEP